MNRICLLAILLAVSAFAGPLRFAPDTIRTGMPRTSPSPISETTKVTNTSGSTVTVSLAKAITKLDHSGTTSYYGSQHGFMFEAPNQLAFAYKVDTTLHSGTSYIQPLSRTNSFIEAGKLDDQRDFSSAEISLAPNQSIVLGVFRVAACWMPAARSLSTTTPVSSCVDEPIDLVFGSTAKGFDTLHIIANRWLSGSGTTPRATSSRPLGDTRQFSADGRPANPGSPTIILGPTGAAPQLR